MSLRGCDFVLCSKDRIQPYFNVTAWYRVSNFFHMTQAKLA